MLVRAAGSCKSHDVDMVATDILLAYTRYPYCVLNNKLVVN